MPLTHLIDTFNQRFIEENHLSRKPLSFDGRKVLGHFENLNFTSELRPIYSSIDPERILGHDTKPLSIRSQAIQALSGLSIHTETANIVNLDRLTRTVHMLNYLLTSHEEGLLFLEVRPNHVLSVTRDHGAYFEEIIRSCGLPTERIVITLGLGNTHQQHTDLLLERLKNYQIRKYKIGIRFENLAEFDWVEALIQKEFSNLSPDFIRFDCPFFLSAEENRTLKGRNSVLREKIRQLRIPLILGGLRHESEYNLARTLEPEFELGLSSTKHRLKNDSSIPSRNTHKIAR